ncbi:DNA ligase-associated metallophosphoesterase [Ancylobacter sp. 3268]|uniref:ligase-associated DNA damage response endonuclease PdeM n=1 Tax=Ancylobacter sp. 3268 TaxID=2817752 RepID=UPI00285DE1E9|nr:ligase-associated DNA damage response endonuclease PdeM [Ancylobacter sp. 3268]MDR6954471.1 DNA ligase-associated metallophosphoesterase [Ancylobacter sp. 3268]
MYDEPDLQADAFGEAGVIALAGIELRLDPAGGLYWPAERMLIVADLHLEKGSSFAARGIALPPYDSRATLMLLVEMAARWRPRIVVSLGDTLHDRRAGTRLGLVEREMLAGLARGREMVWIAGNHDPHAVPELGGVHLPELAVGSLALRHEPRAGATREIAGHLHPVARVVRRGRSVRRRCFATDGGRLVMPALGAYAGGLNVRDRAVAGLFAAPFDAHLIGGARTYRIAHHACAPDR